MPKKTASKATKGTKATKTAKNSKTEKATKGKKRKEPEKPKVDDKKAKKAPMKKIDKKIAAKENAKKAKSAKVDDKDIKTDDKKMVVGIVKGRAMVDAKVPNGKSYHVYEEGNKSYASSLMWSDLKNNNNKYYIIQILQSDANKLSASVWTRWGRVGYDGQYAMQNYPNADSAKQAYKKKYNEKVSKGYTEIEISYEEDEEKKEPAKGKKVKKKDNGDEKEEKSKLDTHVQNLVKLIFNMKLMQQQMVEIGYDAKKMPLGKLSKDTIKRGYQILKNISDVLDKKSKGDLTDLSSKFYTVIPHDFGFKHMSQFVINTKEKLKEKLEMVQSLGDIEIASRLLEKGNKSGQSEVDSNYDKLNCKLITLEKNSEDYKIIEKYLNTTHASTHSYYTLDIQDIFKVDREGEDKRYKKSIGGDMLLWHGSRLTNFVGILSQGLRIAPPEAPVTGYMFGKGIYFADMVSKSANYCAAYSSDNIGLLLLCRVAIGKPRDLFFADYNAGNLPSGRHSTKGVGKTAPGEKTKAKFRNMTVPIGPGVTASSNNTGLLYNEFIIYDITQAKIEIGRASCRERVSSPV